jgi:peptidoglycan hydrolase CwlO-like protein
MTVKRQPAETVDGSDKLELVKWGLSTNVFRLVLVVLVLSMHPIGRGLLSSFGFKFPDEQKITEAATQASAAKSELGQVQASINDVKFDVTDLRKSVADTRANYTIINEKLDRLSTDFTGFQIEFRKPKITP